jgi:hypothetical protein
VRIFNNRIFNNYLSIFRGRAESIWSERSGAELATIIAKSSKKGYCWAVTTPVNTLHELLSNITVCSLFGLNDSTETQ